MSLSPVVEADPSPRASGLTTSVVIPTFRRDGYVRECLSHLAALTATPLEVLVVDATPEESGSPSPTRAVVASFEGRLPVRYLRNELGAGTTPESRGIGVDEAVGDIVAFVDDDAYVAPDWLDELLAPYSAPDVVGVGGRIVNGQPGETEEGLDRIGRLLPDGRLTGYFAADPGRDVDVDHLLGACMSFRRPALLDVGGVHGRYPFPCVCEETDISLRQRARGRRIVFAPRAVVRHVSAPYAGKGDRFDRRYDYFRRRNHLVMLVRIYGPTSTTARRFVVTVLRENAGRIRWAARVLAGRVRGPRGERLHASARLRSPGVLARVAVDLAGLAVGWPVGVRELRTDRALAAARGEAR
ncbi:glycosyltransferase family 2 protein [Isoptericola sp. NPDC019482]|uniref:glycosyltransferase family 2 protein n=1 Tax=Isoptericola sp. NPDC019482 TaxID=3154688 RepID=UPI00349260D0